MCTSSSSGGRVAWSKLARKSTTAGSAAYATLTSSAAARAFSKVSATTKAMVWP